MATKRFVSHTESEINMRGILYYGVMVGLEQLEIVNVKQVRIQTECAPSTVFSIFGCCWSVRIFS
jgi:hypothetical protein